MLHGQTFGELGSSGGAMKRPREGEALHHPRENQCQEQARCLRLGCAIGCPRCHITATSAPSFLPAGQQPAQRQQMHGSWPIWGPGEVLQETFRWDVSLMGREGDGGSFWHSPERACLDVCGTDLVLPSQCADRHMHRAQTCISLHTQENTSSPSTPREAFFLYWDFWWTADFQQLVLLKWRKKAAAAGEGFNPREAAKGSCWQSSFSKATTEGDTGYYTSFIKFKRHLLNWRTSSFPITRAMQPLTTISNICRNVLFGNQAIHAAAAALPIARAGNLAHLNATGSLQYCRLVGV